MSIKKILTPVQSRVGAKGGVEAAIHLAKHFRAHVEAVHIRQAPNAAVDGYSALGVMAVEPIAAITEALADQAQSFFESVRDTAKRSGVEFAKCAEHRDDRGATISWRDQQGLVFYDQAAAARVADLVVMASPAGEESFEDAPLLEDLAFQSGRPVLVAPSGKVNGAPKRIFIAWNGSREAARALSAAEPFLAGAEAALVATAGEIERALPGPESARDLLRLHGLPVEARHIDVAKGGAEDALLDSARAWRADLIVMGAYSHARWREIVLGGFTRKMLKQRDLPLLIAH